MAELEKLTTEELKEFISRDASSSGERWVSGWDEICARLKRMDKSADIFKKPGPCNYAGGGLFRLNPIHVLTQNGITLDVFAFADEGIREGGESKE